MKSFLCLIMVAFGLGSNAQTQKINKIDPELFNDGYYIDNNNKKIYGLIRYVKGNNARLEYKEKSEDKKKKISPQECKEFWVYHTIRFIRVEGSFTVKVGVWNIDISNDFIEVIEEGKIGVYKHYSLSGSGNPNNLTPLDWENFVIKKDNKYIGLHPNIKKRRKQLEELLTGETELIDILCEEKAEVMVSRVQEYNTK